MTCTPTRCTDSTAWLFGELLLPQQLWLHKLSDLVVSGYTRSIYYMRLQCSNNHELASIPLTLLWQWLGAWMVTRALET